MIWVVLVMGLFTELPIRQVFKISRRLRLGEDSPTRLSLCMARQHFGRSSGIGHFSIRDMMLEAAQTAQIDADRLSFKGCFQILKTRLPECDARSESTFTEWCTAVIWELSNEQIPKRRNRINPRVIKRKIS